MLFIKPVFVLKHGLLHVTQSDDVKMTGESVDFGAKTHFLLPLEICGCHSSGVPSPIMLSLSS